ncbi:MAG: hypothetical protein WC512_00200 [Candidatus Omnitrophota bacterium]
MVKKAIYASVAAVLLLVLNVPVYCGIDPGLTVKKYYRPDGSVQKVEIFDADGRKTGEAYYGADGNLDKNPVDDWAAAEWRYSGDRLAEERYYGEDGRLKERKVYGETGDLVDKDYYGGEKNIDEYEEYNTQTFPYGEVRMYE